MDEQIKKRLENLEARISAIETLFAPSADEDTDILEKQHQEFRARIRASRMREATDG